MRNSHKGTGFTLIEMLIGLALLGIILAVATTLTISTMSLSARAMGDAERLGELNSTSGYIGDNLRRALAVKTSLTVNGTTCSLPTCIAILVPEARGRITARPATNIDTYRILVYRVEQRSQLSSAFKTDSSWADANTFVIMEYRSIQCEDTPAVAPSVVPTLCNAAAELTAFTGTTGITNMSGNVVMDSLTLDPSTGSTLFAPLAYNATNNGFVLTLRTKRRESGNVIYTPRASTQVFNVTRRN